MASSWGPACTQGLLRGTGSQGEAEAGNPNRWAEQGREHRVGCGSEILPGHTMSWTEGGHLEPSRSTSDAPFGEYGTKIRKDESCLLEQLARYQVTPGEV